MPELKPCPFCGGEAYTRVVLFNDFTLQFSIICKRCGTRKEYKMAVCDTDFNKVVGAMDIVKADWNRRANNATD